MGTLHLKKRVVSLPSLRLPEAGFEAPFEMLGACHEQVKHVLGLLERLHAHLLYRRHLQDKERLVFSAAKLALSEAALQTMGRDMMRRRGDASVAMRARLICVNKPTPRAM